jgi:hypothetical protein
MIWLGYLRVIYVLVFNGAIKVSSMYLARYYLSEGSKGPSR